MLGTLVALQRYSSERIVVSCLHWRMVEGWLLGTWASLLYRLVDVVHSVGVVEEYNVVVVGGVDADRVAHGTFHLRSYV